MRQRFNAPPGWDVPPDFTPDASWRPDPSWPPAPDGWTWWIPDDAPAAPVQPGDGSTPGYGTPEQGYGTTPQGYGSGLQPGYGSAAASPNSRSVVGGPGAYGSAASSVAAENLVKARRNVFIGALMVVAALVVTIVTFVNAPPGGRFFTPWIALAGVIVAIHGLVEMRKWRRAASVATAPDGAGDDGSGYGNPTQPWFDAPPQPDGAPPAPDDPQGHQPPQR